MQYHALGTWDIQKVRGSFLVLGGVTRTQLMDSIKIYRTQNTSGNPSDHPKASPRRLGIRMHSLQRR